MRIMTIMGTRPEIIRLSETVKKLDAYTNHVLVFTVQSYNYNMSQVFFDELGIREPDYKLVVKADSVGKQMGNILEQCEGVLVKEKPGAVLVLGDTNSALSAGIIRTTSTPSTSSINVDSKPCLTFPVISWLSVSKHSAFHCSADTERSTSGRM